MSFIENLRRQKEMARQEAERARQLPDAKAKQERELRIISEREREVKRQQEIEKGDAFFKRSDLPRLARELAKVEETMIVVQGELKTVIPTTESTRIDGDYHIRYGKEDKSLYEIYKNREELSRRAIKSKNQLAFTDAVDHILVNGAGLTLIWKVYDGSRYPSGYSFFNVVPIGCNSEGTIKFGIKTPVHTVSGTDLVTEINLPFSKWIGNSDVQEEALGIAYKNPRHFVHYYSDGGFRQ